jgi:cell division protein FtsQ
MKRPPGFDPTARPAKPATPPGAPERGTESTRAPAAGTRPSRSRGRAEPEAATEPITLPQQHDRGTPAAGATASVSTPAVVPAAAPKKRRTGGAPRTGAAGVGDAAERPEPPLTARAARLRLRAARKARKQYERSEVRRFTSRSRHRRNVWIGVVATALTLVAFVLVGVFSPLMALRTIEVTGTNRIPAADVAGALDGQLGTPLPLLDLTEVKRELSEFTLIRSFVTESRPPDTLVVRIVEREPVGAITSAAGFDLVDAAGVVIQSGPDRPQGYPIITAATGTSGAGFQAAVAVVGALPDSIRGQLDSAAAATKDDVTLTLVGGARVVWGNAERSEYKAVVLAALIVSHPVGSVTEYDVSSPDSAVVR